MRDERSLEQLHHIILDMVNSLDRCNWRDYQTNVLDNMYNILNSGQPTDNSLKVPYGIYRNVVKSILSHDTNFNRASSLYRKNLENRVLILSSKSNHYLTLCLCLCILFYIREVWGFESMEDNKIIDCEHKFNEIKSRIVERQYDYDWESETCIMNEINLLISSGYVDNRALSVLLSYNEFQLLQGVAPLMGHGTGIPCDVKYDPMVSLHNDIDNIGVTGKVISLDDIRNYLYRCIHVNDLIGDKKICNIDILRSDYMSSMVDVNQLIDIVGRDLLLTLSTTVLQLGERHNVITIKDIVGFIHRLLIGSNELKNKLLLIVPASLLLIRALEVKPDIWDSKKFHSMLDYCHKVVSNSNPGVLHIPDLSYSIRTLANELGGRNAIDYSKIQTRFGRELVNECFGITEPTLESGVYSDVSTVELSELTEGFKVCQDGSIEVSIKDKNTSFVEEYSRNHRLLKLNEKNHDYEAMKYNLVYLVILIETLERDIVYNRNIPPDSEVSLDAQKAIRLAKSDLSIYMDKLRRADKEFNLNEFYRQVKADKSSIKIDTVSTINGIKAIIKTILL